MVAETIANRRTVLKLQQQNELVEQLRNENVLTSTAFKVSKSC